jgi:hypothetical protein
MSRSVPGWFDRSRFSSGKRGRLVSRKRLRTLYVVGLTMGLIGFGLGVVAAGMDVASTDAFVRDLATPIVLLGMGMIGVGAPCMGIAYLIGSQRAVRESGRKWLSSWTVLSYILGEEEPWRGSKP